MKHYGPEPPWRDERQLGYWRWKPADLDSWFDEPGYWEWYPPRSLMARMGELLKTHYQPKMMSDFLVNAIDADLEVLQN